jgi:hypothetical protein
MKVGEGDVQHNKYDGHCTYQWVRIPKAIWTSPSFGKRLTCQTSSNKVFWMKDDLNNEVPNGTPRFYSFWWHVKSGMGCQGANEIKWVTLAPLGLLFGLFYSWTISQKVLGKSFKIMIIFFYSTLIMLALKNCQKMSFR